MSSYLSDYLDDVAFERLMIAKAVPVVPRDVGSSSGVYDLKTGKTNFAITVHETLGMTLDEAVVKLGIVPLAVAAAWKTIDVLLEYALDAVGYSPHRGRRWTIEEKVQHAKLGHGDAPTLSSDSDIWARLLGSYVGLEEVRNSLIHRRAKHQANGDLVGTDRHKNALRRMTQDEQFGFCRAVSRALSAFERQGMSRRERNEALFHLDQVSAWHGQASTGAYQRTYPVPRIEVTVEPPYPFELQLSVLKTRFLGKFGSGHELDLLVKFTGETRQLLLELEATPADDLMLDPTVPPQQPWCVVIT